MVCPGGTGNPETEGGIMEGGGARRGHERGAVEEWHSPCSGQGQGLLACQRPLDPHVRSERGAHASYASLAPEHLVLGGRQGRGPSDACLEGIPSPLPCPRVFLKRP